MSNTGDEWVIALDDLRGLSPFLFPNDSMNYKGSLTWIVNTARSRVGFTSGMRACSTHSRVGLLSHSVVFSNGWQPPLGFS